MDNYDYENGKLVYEDEEIAVIEKPERKRRFLALWIIVGVLYLATTAFMLWTFVDAKVSDSTAEIQLGGLAFIFTLIIYGSIGYLATMLSSIIGLILTCVKRPTTGLRKGQLIYFIAFTVLPIITWILLYLVTFLSFGN